MSLLTTPFRRPVAELSDTALIDAMIEVEAALASVQGRLGVIPAEAAEQITKGLKSLRVNSTELEDGMASAGVPVPALVTHMRASLAGAAAEYLHWGATSQDILDTAHVLCFRRVLERLDREIETLGHTLCELMQNERSTPVLAHTRFQAAVPTVLGLRFAGWLAPLARYRQRSTQLQERLFVVQFGGAAGNLSVLGKHGLEVSRGLADTLGLNSPPLPWHNQRDTIFEFAAWCAGLLGHLGKIGSDSLLAAQSEVREVRVNAGGSSSTMPNKSNPVVAEALVTIARVASGQLANTHGALLHSQERDGAAWAVEWEALTALIELLVAGLNQANELVANLIIDRNRMRANLERDGLAYAEALSFILAVDMPRSKAQALVKSIVQDAQHSGISLFSALEMRSDLLIEPDAVRTLATRLPAAGEVIEAVAEEWRRSAAGIDLG